MDAHILWVDDEIDLLRPHILFLEKKGYEVTSVANGADAVESVRDEAFSLVLLDEQMPGMDGLQTLEQIKEVRPDMPVVMVTKSEEERLMEEALGGKISDYLTKPVNPSQILLTCKRILDRQRLRNEQVSQKYLQSFNEISQALNRELTPARWVDLYKELVRYDIEIEGDEGARQILEDQFEEANRSFGQFVEENYPRWIEQLSEPPGEERPVLSPDVVSQFVKPHLSADRPVVFFVIDCLRYDQWLEFERLLYPHFQIERDFYFGILPTATPYARNAIFSGMMPADIAENYPGAWEQGEESEHSRNQHEDALLQGQLDRQHIDARMRYHKVITSEDGRNLSGHVNELTQADLSAVVVNFVDILTHSRSDSDVLKEIASNERSFRALTRTWFEHSWLYETLRALSEAECTVVITTDHGAIRSLRSTKVIGDRETSTALRYKYGRNLKCDDEHAIYVKDPSLYALPSRGMNTNYILAKEDYYFVYPTNFHHYERLYRDTFQHGGASLEEMILPAATLRPK